MGSRADIEASEASGLNCCVPCITRSATQQRWSFCFRTNNYIIGMMRKTFRLVEASCFKRISKALSSCNVSFVVRTKKTLSQNPRSDRQYCLNISFFLHLFCLFAVFVCLFSFFPAMVANGDWNRSRSERAVSQFCCPRYI